MSEILPNIELLKLFSTRLKNYLLFLQVTNNIELICLITDHLNTKDLLSFLSTSKHAYSWTKVPTIQIRLLKAKVEYYQKPKILPTFQTYFNFLHLKAPTCQAKVKSQKLAKDFQCLKKFNQEIQISKRKRKITTHQPEAHASIKQINLSKQLASRGSQLALKRNMPTINHNIQHSNNNNQNTQKRAIKRRYDEIRQDGTFARFQEIEFKLAKQDFQRRKMKRIQQQNQLQYFMTVQQLKKLAVQDPCSRQILKRIQTEDLKRLHKVNAQRLKIKSIRVQPKQAQKLKIIQEKQKEKLVVIKESIAQKLFNNIKSIISKQPKVIPQK